MARLEASPEGHGLVVRAPSETPIRRVRLLAVGPESAGKVSVGKLYLANIMSGQEVGDDILLPYKSLLAEWQD